MKIPLPSKCKLKFDQVALLNLSFLLSMTDQVQFLLILIQLSQLLFIKANPTQEGTIELSLGLGGVFNQQWKNSRIFLLNFCVSFVQDSGNIIRKFFELNKVELMQSLQHKIPSFLLTLRQMLDNDNQGSIVWWNSGRQFIITDPSRFSQQTLPQYFKHSNLSSFIRQLNIYHFKKLSNHKDPNQYVYHHKYFSKQHPQKINLIRRKDKDFVEVKLQQDSPALKDDKVHKPDAPVNHEIIGKQSKHLNQEIHQLQNYLDYLQQANAKVIEQNDHLSNQLSFNRQSLSNTTKNLSQLLLNSYQQQYLTYSSIIQNQLKQQQGMFGELCKNGLLVSNEHNNISGSYNTNKKNGSLPKYIIGDYNNQLIQGRRQIQMQNSNSIINNNRSKYRNKINEKINKKNRQTLEQQREKSNYQSAIKNNNNEINTNFYNINNRNGMNQEQEKRNNIYYNSKSDYQKSNYNSTSSGGDGPKNNNNNNNYTYHHYGQFNNNSNILSGSGSNYDNYRDNNNLNKSSYDSINNNDNNNNMNRLYQKITNFNNRPYETQQIPSQKSQKSSSDGRNGKKLCRSEENNDIANGMSYNKVDINNKDDQQQKIKATASYYNQNLSNKSDTNNKAITTIKRHNTIIFRYQPVNQFSNESIVEIKHKERGKIIIKQQVQGRGRIQCKVVELNKSQMISDDKIEKQEELKNYLLNNQIISNINGNNNRQ